MFADHQVDLILGALLLLISARVAPQTQAKLGSRLIRLAKIIRGGFLYSRPA